VRNMATLMMLAQGVPMILSGDEVGRSQRGNNNAYCQDNEIGWFDWRLVEANADLLRFFRLLIRLRRNHALLRRATFSAGPVQVDWHGVHLHQPDWSYESRSLAMHIHGRPDERQDHLYLIANAHWEAHEFELPVIPGWEWTRAIDTTLEAPSDIGAAGEETSLRNVQRYPVGPRSVVVLAGRAAKS
jgi:isoamylase